MVGDVISSVPDTRRALAKMYTSNYEMAKKLVEEFNARSFAIKDQLLNEKSRVAQYPMFYLNASSEIQEDATTLIVDCTPRILVRGLGYNRRTKRHNRIVSVPTTKKTGLVDTRTLRSIFKHQEHIDLIHQFDEHRVRLEWSMNEAVSQLRTWNRYFEKQDYLSNTYKLGDLIGGVK